MGLEHNLSTSGTSGSSPYSKKKLILEKFKQARPAYSSSSSSLEVSKEKTINEKLFIMECKELRKNFNKSSDSNIFSSNSSDRNEQLQNEMQFNFYNANDPINVVSTEGVLHLKEPLINKKNESIFYENRGRMEPMDWSMIHNDKKTDSIKKKIDIRQRIIKKVTTINQQSKYEPEANPEFLNFVQNSTTSKIIYEVRNNFVGIPIDLPISTLQRQLKSCPVDSLLVTQKIKNAFKFSQSDIYMIDLIDKSDDKSITEFSKESMLQEIPISLNNSDALIIRKSKNNSNGSKDLCKFDSRDNLSLLGIQNVISGERKIDFDKYDDEMFNFKKSSSQSNLQDDLKTSKEEHQINKGLLTSSNSNVSSPKAQLYFNKLKNIRKVKLNNSLDSDDILADTFNKQNDDSISKKSMTFNYEIFKNKLKNTSTEYSITYNETHNVEQKIKQEEVKEINNQFITKEMQTRNYIMSNCNAFKEETNMVKISNIKICPKSEPLMTAVSTRYFPKSLRKLEDDTKIQDIDEITKNINTEMLTPINVNKSFCGIKSDSSQDTFLSFDNITNDNKLQDVASDKDEDDNLSIFYSCKYNDSINSSVIIEEVNNSEALEIQNPLIPHSNSTGDSILALYNDIDSDEEFDIVNIDQFPPYSSIYNKLMEVKEAQRAIATGALDVEDTKFDNKAQIHFNYKQNGQAIKFDKSKSTESSLEISDNHYSSIDASISSNAESDYKASAVEFPNLLLNTKDNIFANLKIDNIQLNNSILDYYGKKPELKLIDSVPSSKDKVSMHKKKMTDALNKYRKIMKFKDAKIEKDDDSVQLQQNESSSSQKISKRLQILNQMKKRKAQLTDNQS